MRIAFNTLFSAEVIQASINQYFDRIDVNINLVSMGTTDMSLVPLHLLPLTNSDSNETYSLISLLERRYFIAIHRELVNPIDKIGFHSNALLHVPHEFEPSKLLTIKSDLKIKHQKVEDVLLKMNANEVGCFVVEGCFMKKVLEQKYHFVKLNEREFGHAPGQGFLALRGPRDHKLATIFKRQRVKDEIAICNIERKMAGMANFKINNHCEFDAEGNFHLWGFGSMGEVSLSQSTRNNLEERALRKLETLK